MSDNQENTRKGRGCGFGCALMIGLLVGIGLLVTVVLMSSVGLLSLPQEQQIAGLFHKGHCAGEMGEDESPYMIETWSSGHGDVKVVRIPVSGMIMLGESSWYAGNANTVLRSIRRATHDPEVEGLILEINSGGGGITDSDVLYKALLDFKSSQKGRVIVSVMGDMAASGAYYIALASDYIMAHPTTLTGSIGVIMQSYNFKELAAKLGVQDVTIKSGANKDLLNPFQDVKPEQKEILQKVISAMHDRFVTLVAENRKLPKETVLPLADGRVFLAGEAVTNKLIDGIGYNEDAQAKIAELLETGGVKVYRYDEQVTLMDLFTSSPGIGMRFDLNRFMHESAQGARLMFHWTW
ncbi:MAG TPA: signal peptide peptidase SppA [Kiritimatiellia bacterium]|nr:signal peptide peptidase SppA [Kiritimatiellia bacterium]HPS09082.1 signal peptide peptidase SppA [Kiritimatiellia bacterium]